MTRPSPSNPAAQPKAQGYHGRALDWLKRSRDRLASTLFGVLAHLPAPLPRLGYRRGLMHVAKGKHAAAIRELEQQLHAWFRPHQEALARFLSQLDPSTPGPEGPAAPGSP